MIPKIISFVWIGPKLLPDWAAENIERFRALNPKYRTQVVGEEVLLPAFQQAYSRIKGEHEWSRKSDILRVCILLRTGGWYFDTDFLLIEPLDSLRLTGNKTYLTHASYLEGRPWIANGVIGTKRDSPFLALVTTQIIMTGQEAKILHWGSYGPCIFTQLARQYPDLIFMGRLDDYYRFQIKEQAQMKYKKIRESGFNSQIIEQQLGIPLPIALHMSMQDKTEL
jgi:mannosyltransferase OCH1-like enzyme